MTNALRSIRGLVIAPHPTEHRLDVHPDAVIRLTADGRIDSVDDAATSPDVPVTWPGTAILPGFVDTHIHFPQTRILGSASGPLLDWLDASVYPEEQRFNDRSYAASVAAQFCDALLAQGTTAAGVYSSSHLDATDALFTALDRCGLRAQAGITLMNRGAPGPLLLDTDAAVNAAETLLERWHGHDGGRLRFCVTPRFALSCDSPLLGAAADLAARHGLYIQTHLSENPDELRDTAKAFPAAADYLAVYEQHGLVGDRTIFAHCVHLSDNEWQRIARHDAVVAHCPDSNFFLGSGTMPLADALRRGIRVGLGTDVGAGRTFSMQRVASGAYDAALIEREPVSSETLLWLATRGGANALGFGECIGSIAPGYDADLVAIDVPDDTGGPRLFDALLFNLDRTAVRATVTRGVPRWRRDVPV